MRCLALADALRRAAVAVTFVCREHQGNLCEVIAQAGFEVVTLKVADSADADSRIGASWQQDAAETYAAIDRMGRPVDWLIVDHYALDTRWESALRTAGQRILAIDDLADRPHDCDVLLDQNLYDDAAARYVGLVPAHCVQALGPTYALLRPQFYEARASLRQRDGTIRRVLVAMGGADATDETRKALEALCDKDLGALDIDVLVGGLYRHKQRLRARYGRESRMRFHESTANVAALMAAADLSIGGGGTMNWERCLLGLPTLVIVIAQNQRETNEALHRAGIVLNLGWYAEVAAGQIAATVRRIVADPAAALQLSRRSLALMGPQDPAARGPQILKLLLGSYA